MIHLFIILTLVCWFILIPLNTLGDQVEIDAEKNNVGYYSGFPQWSIANVNQGDDIMWIHFIIFIIFNIYALYKLFQIKNELLDLRMSYLNTLIAVLF